MAEDDRGQAGSLGGGTLRSAIISTSIHAAPGAYEAWVQQGDLYVAGDVNSSARLAGYVEHLGGAYIHPHDQDWPWSTHVGFRNVQRRNAALALALVGDYDVITTVDDDNYPLSSKFVQQHALSFSIGQEEVPVVHTGDHWLDIGQLVEPPVRQRGVPLDHGGMTRIRRFAPEYEIGVVQAHIVGDPDCDALFRLTEGNVIVKRRVEDVNVALNTWVPFNSQATVWSRRFAPLMACLPGIGRYDDIWASLIAQRVMHEYHAGVRVSAPAVAQVRNAHDVKTDLENELYGMSRTVELVHKLEAVSFDETRPSPLRMYRACADKIQPLIPDDTYKFMHAWAEACEGMEDA